MSRGAWLGPLVLAMLCLVGARAAAAVRQGGAFVVGIVEANGHLVPFARFDGDNWSADLQPDTSTEYTESDWTLWLENPGTIEDDSRLNYDWTDPLGPAESPFRTTDGTQSTSPCSSHPALDTTLGPQPELIACDFCCPEPKRGIATTGSEAPKLVERIDSSGESASRIAALIGPSFGLMERTTIGERLDSGVRAIDNRLPFTGHPTDEASRAGVPIRLDVAFRVEIGTDALYYVEARRDYQPIADARFPCPGVSFLRAWVHLGSETRRAAMFEPDLRLLDCDLKEGEFDRPIAYWPREDGTADVIFRRLGWESESYGIVTVGSTGVAAHPVTAFRR